MRNILILLLLVFITLPSMAGRRKVKTDANTLELTEVLPVRMGIVSYPVRSDVNRMNLVGKVKQLQTGAITYTFNRDGYILVEDCVIKPADRKEDQDMGREVRKGYKRITTYDDYNRPTSITEHDENNIFSYGVRISYANGGKMVTVDTIMEDGRTLTRENFKYDVNGRLIESNFSTYTYTPINDSVDTMSVTLQERRISKMASDNSNWVLTTYNNEGAVIATDIYYYDVTTGNIIESISRQFDNGETYKWHNIYFYDEDGLLTKQQLIREDGTLYKEERYTYYITGVTKRKTIINYSSTGFNTGEHIYHYNRDGELIKSCDEGFVYEFDAWENVLATHPLKQKRKSSIEYQLDGRGNWIRKEISTGSKKERKTTVRTRTILYY